MAARLAQKVTVNLLTHELSIDGQVFPYYIGDEGVEVRDLGTRTSIPSVVIRILAETVEVVPAEVTDRD